MAGPNTEPVFSRVADIQLQVNMTAANTTIDITSGTSYLLFTADATNGGWVDDVVISPNPSQNTAATVFRIWMNNGSTTGTDTNSSLIANAGMPATTASNSAALPFCSIPIRRALPPGYRLYLTMGTAPGGSGEFNATTYGSKY